MIKTNKMPFEANSKSSSLNKIWVVFSVILAAVLVWLVITKSLVAYTAKTSPETALLLRSNDAVSLISLVSDQLDSEQFKTNKPKTDDAQKVHASKKLSTTEMAQSVKQALLDDPLSSRALRVLGQLSEGEDHDVIAEKYMRLAVKLSIRESLATFWLIKSAYLQKDYEAVIRYTIILLWNRPALTKQITPMLTTLAENPETRSTINTLLISNPKWRVNFFRYLPNSITDIRTPLNLLLHLKQMSAPPTEQEINYYIDFLLKNNRYDQAYYTWLQLLPSDHLTKAGFLFNGSFEMAPDRTPFNWTLTKGKAYKIEIASRPDNPIRRALNIHFLQGRINKYRLMSQLVVLSPGKHNLEGRLMGELNGSRGLRWIIECRGSKKEIIGKTPMFINKQSQWKRFEISFEVPFNDCPAQLISLIFDARTASEKLVSGKVWYDDLKITPKLISR